jgi:ATP-dependent helicase HrpA
LSGASGETGSGKTTQIPKFCLTAGRGIDGKIACTQPRRIAATTVAGRIAEELGEELGQSVGYKIRFQDKTDPDAYIKVVTDGILLAETQGDPWLNEYDTIIVDEAHERSLNIDFVLGILKRLVQRRKNLKLIITSATIDTEKFSKAFDDAPVIEVSGRMFPVETIYAPISGGEGGPEDQGYVEAAAEAAANLLSTTRTGDILIFMPTEQDIGETMEILRGKQQAGVSILPLFARLSAKEQSKVFSTGPGRKVVVSTNVAETSLTIPGIKYVIDTGLARIPSYSPRTRTTALPVAPISQSSANQRKGRCGRVENGICIRLYDEDEFTGRPFFTSPEILRSNLAEVILRMLSLGLGEVSSFPFIDPPAPKSIKDGFDTLMELSAIQRPPKKGKKNTEGKFVLSPMGKTMARLPMDPKLSRILIQAAEAGCLAEAVTITTALTVSDIRQRPADKAQAADQKHAAFKDPASDFITLLNIWQACQKAAKTLRSRSKLRRWCIDNYLSFKRLREWQDIHRQITRMLKDHGIVQKQPSGEETVKGQDPGDKAAWSPLYVAVHKALLHGYLAGIAHKKEKNLYMAAKGQQAMIFPGSGLFNKAGTWIMAAEFVKTSQLFARGVANIDPAWLEEIAGDLCTRTYSDPRWEKKRGEVVADEQVSLFGLVIVNSRKKAYGRINPQEASELFIRHALVQGEVYRPFPFMDHNQALIRELEALEDKTRTRDILATEDDLFLFYQSRLPKPFYDLRSFAKFLKGLETDDRLRMTREDIQKGHVDRETLSRFPDRMEMAQGEFALEYNFDPGADTDGVTLKVPTEAAAMVSRHRVDRLVPGLFEEKVIALIKALPKQYRKRLVPVQETAAAIAAKMPRKDKPLFAQLSEFIRDQFATDIPASAWSDKDLPDHLKMRVSLRDEKDREIKSLRDLSKLGKFAASRPKSGPSALDRARARYEKEGITQWNFGDLPDSISLDPEKGFVRQVFIGLKVENQDRLALRLSSSETAALDRHKAGVARLFELSYPDDVKALKKDIRTADGIKKIAPYFNGPESFHRMLYQAIAGELFAENIRSAQAFQRHAEQVRPRIYEKGQALINSVGTIGREYEKCFVLLQKLSLQHRDKPATSELLTQVFNELKNLCPPHFLELYDFSRLASFPRYIAGLSLRARRAAENPAKEAQKGEQIAPFSRRLSALVEGLDEGASPEKTRAVEDFYWLIEEYKISVYAQELKTAVKVSAKRLEKAYAQAAGMV